jgi:hypothetical protein
MEDCIEAAHQRGEAIDCIEAYVTEDAFDLGIASLERRMLRVIATEDDDPSVPVLAECAPDNAAAEIACAASHEDITA